MRLRRKAMGLVVRLQGAVATTLDSLNGYDVDQSLSGLVLATEGVGSLTLKTVRVVNSEGQILTVTINRNVLEPTEQLMDQPTETPAAQ